ncbi:hypothetical protein LOTGIDRAFT_239167 [Lottia gigantea]|uniref:Uncharacterized protein n=1 Tax=Lottia gigantea TaxID=225164 RepID=V4ATV2_LOTGI|nr:hypothetical protein LOTGIDRAFT_239167 [Lottia gigantea]ESO97201.1 hypothetical protein LOTGIDRAFT_239167 [Lottia gigantea]
MSASTRNVASSQANSTSLDQYVCNTGSPYQSPDNMASYVFMGPSYYIPGERKWVSVNDYKSLPLQVRRDAILFESEVEWRKYNQRNTYTPGFSTIGAKYPSTFTSLSLPQHYQAWNRRWNGSGYFVPTEHAWIREQVGPNIPTDSLLFYNEEDWLKFKYMNENPSMLTSTDKKIII